jgi:hypothetical protein
MLNRLARWFAHRVMRRPPDKVIGYDYLSRWHIWQSRWRSLYLHVYSGDDDPRALHDHPWWSVSYTVHGSYQEIIKGEAVPRVVVAGQWRLRSPRLAHRIKLFYSGDHPITLFLTGPRVREWGFHCPQGWRPWYEFVDDGDPGQVGRGCD